MSREVTRKQGLLLDFMKHLMHWSMQPIVFFKLQK